MLNDFISENWFDLIQSIFIVGGFMLSFLATRNDIRSRKIEHLLLMNQNYQEIWSKTYSHPELLRIRQTNLNLEEHPITAAEHRIVKEIIIHVHIVYEAIKNGQLDKGEMENDIADFLSLPIPNYVWHKVQVYYNEPFVAYINELLSKSK